MATLREHIDLVENQLTYFLRETIGPERVWRMMTINEAASPSDAWGLHDDLETEHQNSIQKYAADWIGHMDSIIHDKTMHRANFISRRIVDHPAEKGMSGGKELMVSMSMDITKVRDIFDVKFRGRSLIHIPVDIWQNVIEAVKH